MPEPNETTRTMTEIKGHTVNVAAVRVTVTSPDGVAVEAPDASGSPRRCSKPARPPRKPWRRQFTRQAREGAVILTNLGAAHAWHSPFRRKLLELLFDGRDEAREDFAYAWKNMQDSLLDDTKKFDFEPYRAWLERLAGTYENPALGKVTVRIEGKRGIFDTGEWNSPIGRKKNDDGTVRLVLTAPARFTIRITPEEINGMPILRLEFSQQGYIFKPVKGET